MSDDHDEVEAQFERLLAAYHDDLVAGREPCDADWTCGDELASRLRAARQCVHDLHALWNPLESTRGFRATRPHDDDPSAPSIFAGECIGRFQIERELGEGGGGVVLLAVDPKLRRQVALKVPRPEILVSQDSRERFLREAEVAARLAHPHIVSVYEVGEAGPVCYIAAEFCVGPSLAAWLRRRTELVPVRDAAALVADLAAGVQHAHDRGVLHRDLKPSNILLQRIGEPVPSSHGSLELRHYVAKVADFGLAKSLEHEGDETRTGTILGTPRYMAPEQAEGRNRDVGPHTDVYALGTILYEMLTGVSPHRGLTDSDTLRRVLLDDPLPPRRLRGDVPADLEAICLKCLEKDHRQRYPTAATLAADLSRYLAGRPTVARPMGPAGRMWKWARRRPAVAGLSAALVVAVAALVVGSVTYSALLKSALNEMTHQRQVAKDSDFRRRQLAYTADVRRAHDAWKNGRPEEMRELLNRYVPAPGEPDLREFSWYHLRELGGRPVAVLRGHAGDVFCVAYSPNGKLLATAGLDGTVRTWKVEGGQPLHVLTGHADEVTSVAFAPDGDTLASASEDGTVRLWDLASGTCRAVLVGHSDHVMAVAYSADGKLLASGARDATVRIWDGTTGVAVTTLSDATDMIRALAFSPSGELLFAADEAGDVNCWQTSGWKHAAHMHLPPEGAESERLFALALAPDRSRLAAAGRTGRIWICDAALRGKPLQQLEGGHASWIQSLVYLPGGERLLSAGKDGLIQSWNLRDPPSHRPVLAHDARIWSVALSPDAEHMTSAGADGTVRVWNLKVPDGTPEAYPRLPRPSHRFTFTPNGRYIVASCNRRGACWLDTATHALLKDDLSIDYNQAPLRFSPNGRLIAVRVTDTHVRGLDETADRLTIPGRPGDYLMPAWSPDSKRLATTVGKTCVHIVDVESGRVLHELDGEQFVEAVEFSPDGSQFALAGGDRTFVYRLTSMEVAAEIGPARSLQYSADSSLLVTEWHHEIAIHDARTYRRLHKLALEVDNIHLTLTPDGRTLATYGEELAQVILWDTRTGQELFSLDPPASTLHAIRFSPAGDRLVAVGEDENSLGFVWEWAIEHAP